MPKSPESHADNWDLRHEDFNDNDFLYDVYAVMRQGAPFAHTDTPFLSATPGGAWVAVSYAECYKILQDWEHFSSNPTPEGAEQLAGDLVITLDPPRQQKFRKVLNPYFSPARMKALRPEIRDETDVLIDEFIESGSGDLAQVAWRQPGIVFFKYVLGMPIDDVPLCLDLTDTALNGETEQDRMAGSIHGIPRTVAQEVELSGHTFCPGDSVLVNYAAANRDAAEFPESDRCIVDRQSNRHLGFGAGVHRCIGSNLARLEFQVGVEQVLDRLADFSLAPDVAAEFHGNSVTRGFRYIPVVLTPAERSFVSESWTRGRLVR